MAASPRNITLSHYETLASLRQALRRFLSFSKTAALEAGIPPQQHQALLAIKGTRNGVHVSISELAERLGIRHHSAVGLVDRLVKRKLVKRQDSRDDRRRVDVSVTARGEKLIKRLSSVHLQEFRQIGPELRRLLDLVDQG